MIDIQISKVPIGELLNFFTALLILGCNACVLRSVYAVRQRRRAQHSPDTAEREQLTTAYAFWTVACLMWTVLYCFRVVAASLSLNRPILAPIITQVLADANCALLLTTAWALRKATRERSINYYWRFAGIVFASVIALDGIYLLLGSVIIGLQRPDTFMQLFSIGLSMSVPMALAYSFKRRFGATSILAICSCYALLQPLAYGAWFGQSANGHVTVVTTVEAAQTAGDKLLELPSEERSFLLPTIQVPAKLESAAAETSDMLAHVYSQVTNRDITFEVSSAVVGTDSVGLLLATTHDGQTISKTIFDSLIDRIYPSMSVIRRQALFLRLRFGDSVFFLLALLKLILAATVLPYFVLPREYRHLAEPHRALKGFTTARHRVLPERPALLELWRDAYYLLALAALGLLLWAFLRLGWDAFTLLAVALFATFVAERVLRAFTRRRVRGGGALWWRSRLKEIARVTPLKRAALFGTMVIGFAFDGSLFFVLVAAVMAFFLLDAFEDEAGSSNSATPQSRVGARRQE